MPKSSEPMQSGEQQLRDGYASICIGTRATTFGLSVFSELDDLLALAGRDMDKRRGLPRHFRLIRPDLKIWNAPRHLICILHRFQCFARLSSAVCPHPGLSSFHRLRCKLQYSRAIRSDMIIYASLDQNNVLFPSHVLLNEAPRLFVFSFMHLCNLSTKNR